MITDILQDIINRNEDLTVNNIEAQIYDLHKCIFFLSEENRQLKAENQIIIEKIENLENNFLKGVK